MKEQDEQMFPTPARLQRSVLAAALVAVVAVASSLQAAEFRVVRFYTVPGFGASPCDPLVGWFSQTLFHNSTDAAQTVRFLGVSNGSPGPNPRPLTVPPHQTVSIQGMRSTLGWEPVQPTFLWVNTLDVPTGVVVANRVESGVSYPCANNHPTYAGLPLPTVTALVPAGTTQYFLGTDTGTQSNDQVTDARLNIGVFNGGLGSATATVKVYCGFPATDHPFPDTLLQTTQFQAPVNTVVQTSVMSSTQAAGCPSPGESFWYATVTVDQPSFAYAIGLTNGALPTFPGNVALAYTSN
jgi:hypothetical protein